MIAFGFNNTHKTFADEKNKTLNGFSLEVKTGRRVSLIGPSGCGKTTTLKLLAGLQKPDNDSITNNTKNAGYVFQEPNLMPWATVEDNIWLPLRLRGIRKKDANRRIGEWIEKVELEGYERYLPSELSGGMKMRCSVARALITEPDLVLMDEPFASLDEITRFKLNDLIIELHTLTKFTLLLVTHSIYESVFLGEEIVVMTKNGKVDLTVEVVRPNNDPSSKFRDTKQYAEICTKIRKPIIRNEIPFSEQLSRLMKSFTIWSFVGPFNAFNSPPLKRS